MVKGLEDCGIPQTEAGLLAEKMEAYIKEIILFNSAYNLTNTSDRDELVVRHIFDSLSAFVQIKNLLEELNQANERSEVFNPILIADIGSGGGLPGIPLSAAIQISPEKNPWLKNVQVQLVERMEKRCAFLENCIAILGLKNVSVVNSEAERLAEKTYDLITFRAFRPLDKKMAKTLLRIVKEGAYLCAYKAKAENIREEMSAISSMIPEYQVKELFVPELKDTERNLVIIQK